MGAGRLASTSAAGERSDVAGARPIWSTGDRRGVLRRVAQEVPVVGIGRVLSVSALGQFNYGLRFAIQPFHAVISIGSYVLLPAFARLSAHDARFRAAVLRALRWMCVIAFPAGLLLVPLGTPAMVLIFGEQWRPAGHVAMALGVMVAAVSLDSIASEAWKASDRTRMLPRMHGLSLALTVILVAALVPFGLVAVSIGLSVAAVGVGIYATRGVAAVAGFSLERRGQRSGHRPSPRS